MQIRWTGGARWRVWAVRVGLAVVLFVVSLVIAVSVVYAQDPTPTPWATAHPGVPTPTPEPVPDAPVLPPWWDPDPDGGDGGDGTDGFAPVPFDPAGLGLRSVVHCGDTVVNGSGLRENWPCWVTCEVERNVVRVRAGVVTETVPGAEATPTVTPTLCADGSDWCCYWDFSESDGGWEAYGGTWDGSAWVGWNFYDGSWMAIWEGYSSIGAGTEWVIEQVEVWGSGYPPQTWEDGLALSIAPLGGGGGQVFDYKDFSGYYGWSGAFPVDGGKEGKFRIDLRDDDTGGQMHSISAVYAAGSGPDPGLCDSMSSPPGGSSGVFTGTCQIEQALSFVPNEGVAGARTYAEDLDPTGLVAYDIQTVQEIVMGVSLHANDLMISETVGGLRLAYSFDAPDDVSSVEEHRTAWAVLRDGAWYTDTTDAPVDPPLDIAVTDGECYVVVPEINNPFDGVFGGGMVFGGMQMCLKHVSIDMNLPLLGDPMPYLTPTFTALIGLIIYRLLRGV